MILIAILVIVTLIFAGLAVAGLVKGQGQPLTSREVEASSDSSGYWFSLLIALDIFANAFIPRWLLGPTVLGETISARCGRFAATNTTHPVARALAWFLNLIQKNHVDKAVAGSLARFKRGVELETQALGRDA